jgi:hypothetical protein
LGLEICAQERSLISSPAACLFFLNGGIELHRSVVNDGQAFFLKPIILLDRLTALDKDGTNIVLTQLNGIGLGKIAHDWTKRLMKSCFSDQQGIQRWVCHAILVNEFIPLLTLRQALADP